MIRIANGQGFRGDSIDAPLQQIRGGPIGYLTLDYLAEVTMSILQKQRSRDPESGYARDFVEMLRQGECLAFRERIPFRPTTRGRACDLSACLDSEARQSEYYPLLVKLVAADRVRWQVDL